MMQLDITRFRTPSRHPKDELRASLYSLAETFPADECDPEDCPLFRVRRMKYMERLMWFGALSEDDLVYLNTYYHICLNTKLAANEVA
jgi:hypothetical protein